MGGRSEGSKNFGNYPISGSIMSAPEGWAEPGVTSFDSPGCLLRHKIGLVFVGPRGGEI